MSGFAQCAQDRRLAGMHDPLSLLFDYATFAARNAVHGSSLRQGQQYSDLGQRRIRQRLSPSGTKPSPRLVAIASEVFRSLAQVYRTSGFIAPAGRANALPISQDGWRPGRRFGSCLSIDLLSCLILIK